jgi:hypothetical protein
VSTADDQRWVLQRERLSEALERWRRQRPGSRSRELVNEFLMDLVDDPFSCGEQDGESGVWTGLPGEGIVVVYVPDAVSRSIAVADISFA